MIQTTDLINVLRVLRSAKEEYLIAQADLKECDDKTQDILHDLELVDHSYHERAVLAKELAETRKKRREAKNTVELLDPLAAWCVQHESTSIRELQQILGQMRKQDERHANRIYSRRTAPVGELIVPKKKEGRT